VELLLAKAPAVYQPAFRREGVFHEIEALASRTITSSKPKDKAKDADKEGENSSDSVPPPPIPVATLPGLKKLSSLSLDPDDAITLRCRVLRFRYLSDERKADGDSSFAQLRELVGKISVPEATEEELAAGLWELAQLFSSPRTSVSSFELLQSGVVDGLLQFATDEGRSGASTGFDFFRHTLNFFTVGIKKRKELLLEAFAGKKASNLAQGQSPFSILVKKLQESLTRMESFTVTTISQNTDGEFPESQYGSSQISFPFCRFQAQLAFSPRPSTQAATCGRLGLGYPA